MEPDTFAAVLHSLIKENMTKLVGREAGHSWMLLSCQVPTFFRHTQRIPKMVARESTASAGAGLLGSLGGRKEEFFGGNVILRAGN